MKNDKSIYSNNFHYYFIFIFLLLIAFKAGNYKSQYSLPLAAYSVTAGDIDLDGDNDIVVGHKTAWQQSNPTITLLGNINCGTFEIVDTSNIFLWVSGKYFN